MKFAVTVRERKREKKGERETDRIFVHWFTPQIASMARVRTGPVPGLEPGTSTRFPTWVQGLKDLSNSWLLSQPVSRKLD